MTLTAPPWEPHPSDIERFSTGPLGHALPAILLEALYVFQQTGQDIVSQTIFEGPFQLGPFRQKRGPWLHAHYEWLETGFLGTPREPPVDPEDPTQRQMLNVPGPYWHPKHGRNIWHWTDAPWLKPKT